MATKKNKTFNFFCIFTGGYVSLNNNLFLLFFDIFYFDFWDFVIQNYKWYRHFYYIIIEGIRIY